MSLKLMSESTAMNIFEFPPLSTVPIKVTTFHRFEGDVVPISAESVPQPLFIRITRGVTLLGCAVILAVTPPDGVSYTGYLTAPLYEIESFSSPADPFGGQLPDGIDQSTAQDTVSALGDMTQAVFGDVPGGYTLVTTFSGTSAIDPSIQLEAFVRASNEPANG